MWTKGLTHLQYVMLGLKHDFNHLTHSIKYRKFSRLYLHSGRAATKESVSAANHSENKLIWTENEFSLKGCSTTDFVVLLEKGASILFFPIRQIPFGKCRLTVWSTLQEMMREKKSLLGVQIFSKASFFLQYSGKFLMHFIVFNKTNKTKTCRNKWWKKTKSLFQAATLPL